MYEPIDTLYGLLKHYSPSRYESEAVNWLVSHMKELGFGKSYLDSVGNSVGVIGEGEKEIIFLGHIDTVEGEIEIRRDGDFLYGRGSVDAKGPLATFVQATARLGLIPGWKMIVIGAIGEEKDSIGARSILNQYQPDYVVIGEPSHWKRITIGYKGSAKHELFIKKDRFHSARSDDNACETAFQIWDRIKKWTMQFNSNEDQLFYKLQVSLQGFISGEQNFHDWSKLSISARLPPQISPEEYSQELSKICDPYIIEENNNAIPAYLAQKNTPLVRSFLAGIRELGERPGFVRKTGTADMNIVAPVWGCPIIAYGPGDSSLDHTPHEHISIREYENAIQVIINSIKNLVKQA